MFFFFFKQKTAYEMRISDWSSDVCSSDLAARNGARRCQGRAPQEHGGAQIFAPDQERERDRLIRLVPKGNKKDPPASCQRVLFCARYCDSQVAIVLQRGK